MFQLSYLNVVILVLNKRTFNILKFFISLFRYSSFPLYLYLILSTIPILVVRHLFPVMSAKEKISRGTLKPSEVPYEQRQGRYDNKDVNVGYVPSGLSVHEWHDMQRAEKRKLKEKDFKATGPKGFKSRSFQAFQEDLEKGKVKHLFPTMFARENVAKGLIKEEDVAVSAEDCALLPLPRRSN